MKSNIILAILFACFVISCNNSVDRERLKAELKAELEADQIKKENEQLKAELKEAKAEASAAVSEAKSHKSAASSRRRAVINDPDGYTNVRAGQSSNSAIVT